MGLNRTEMEGGERPRATGLDVGTAYRAMGLSRREAAGLMGISDSRLGQLEASSRPLFNRFNWELLAALGNEYHKRLDSAGLPECPWLKSWGEEWLSDSALKERSREEHEAADEERARHRESCEVCAVSLKWAADNPDPAGYLFPAPATSMERIFGWLPVASLLLAVVAARVVADQPGSGYRGVGVFLMGIATFYVLTRAQKAGYLP